MTITYPRTLPAGARFASSRFAIETNVQVFESPITRQQQHLARPGTLISGLYTLPPMTAAEAREWKAWLVSMQGPVKTFLAYDPDALLAVGAGQNGQGLVNGAAQTGNSLVTDGWPASTLILKAGDYVQVGTVAPAIQLKLITEDVTSDGLGAATLAFEPALHKSPADNAAIVVDNPAMIARLVDTAQAAWEADAMGLHGFSFAFVEVPEI